MNSKYSNFLLQSVSPATSSRLQASLSRVELIVGEVIQGENEPVTSVIFPEEGLISLVMVASHDMMLEIGVVGCEGMTGQHDVLLQHPSSVRSEVQVAGWGWRLDANEFRSICADDEDFKRRVLEYLHFVHAQAAQSAVCNRLHTVEERLSRWLLMVSDHLGRDQFELWRPFIASMLGARASTVPIALGMLQQAGLMTFVDNIVTIQRREELESSACECYPRLRLQMQLFQQSLGATTDSSDASTR
jgi:CRP-like cAMP-binding protein